MSVTENPPATPSLPRAAPEAEGVSSPAILAFLDAVREKKLELHSVMLLRRGKVLAEGWWRPYAPERHHMLYSLSKSFLSTAAGLAIAEGYFALDDTVVSFFPDELPPAVSENLAAMQVRHLLAMATGHAQDKTGALRNGPSGDWVRKFLAEPVEHVPGTLFVYNSAATFMVSAILQKTTGQTALDFLTPRLLGPLGITDATWETNPDGIVVGGWGLNIRTEEIARFGETYRRRGVWNEQPLVPADWVETATRAQVSNGDPATPSDWAQGYGFQFWRCQHGAFRADGAFGQFCVVLPAQEAVFVTTANVSDLQAVLDLVWDILLPAMSDVPLSPDAETEAALTQRLSDLQIEKPTGATTSPVAEKVAGRTYRFGENEQQITAVKAHFAADAAETVTLEITDDAGTHTLTARLGEWRVGTTRFLRDHFSKSLQHTGDTPPDTENHPVAAAAAWTDDRTLTVRLCLIETPFTPTLVLRFDGETGLNLALQGRIGFGPADRPTLEGTAG